LSYVWEDKHNPMSCSSQWSQSLGSWIEPNVAL